jgi:hypothetical protein
MDRISLGLLGLSNRGIHVSFKKLISRRPKQSSPLAQITVLLETISKFFLRAREGPTPHSPLLHALVHQCYWATHTSHHRISLLCGSAHEVTSTWNDLSPFLCVTQNYVL